MFDTVAESMHELFGLTGTYLPATGASVPDVTVRAQSGQATDSTQRQARRERTTAILYLRQSDIATRPTREALISITASGSPWLGDWTLTADAEPTSDAEWRCLCLSERTNHTIAASGGAKRPARG